MAIIGITYSPRYYIRRASTCQNACPGKLPSSSALIVCTSGTPAAKPGRHYPYMQRIARIDVTCRKCHMDLRLPGVSADLTFNFGDTLMDEIMGATGEQSWQVARDKSLFRRRPSAPFPGNRQNQYILTGRFQAAPPARQTFLKSSSDNRYNHRGFQRGLPGSLQHASFQAVLGTCRSSASGLQCMSLYREQKRYLYARACRR